MKVLVLGRGYISKKYPMNGIFEIDQAIALKKNGVDIAYCCIDRRVRKDGHIGIEAFEYKGVPIYRCHFPVGSGYLLPCYNYFAHKLGKPVGGTPLGIALDNFIAWQMFKKLYERKILKEWGKPNIIHAHFGRMTGYIALKAKEQYQLEYVLTEHDTQVSSCNVTKAQKKQLIEIYSNAGKNIAVSKSFQKVLNEKYYNNFEYIPNIIDISLFSQSKQCEKNKFVSIGSLMKKKNFSMLLEAFAQVKYKDAQLAIIGVGPEKNNLIKLTKSLGITDRVEFKGFLPRNKFNEIFDESFCFVLASKYETFGVVFVEAMASGLPVIATRCGGPESFINDSVGLTVDVDDLDGLVIAMENMIENKHKYKSDVIRQYVIDEFSSSVTARKIIKVYEDILSKDSDLEHDV